MLVAPDNFLYFITLFTISISGGIYLFFSYHRNRLLLVNALMFFLCAIRICTEYYLPQIDTLSAATNIAIFHSIIGLSIYFCMWYCAWFYIRPFRYWKQEKIINSVFLWGLIIIPLIIRIKTALERTKFFFYEKKIEGYWKFATKLDTWDHHFNDLHTLVMHFIMISILFVGIWQTKNDRIQKTLLMLSFVILPFLYFIYFQIPDEFIAPNVGGLFLSHVLIVSWFVSEYRLFTNSFEEVTNDLLNSISDLAISTDLSLKINNSNHLSKAIFELTLGQEIATLIANNSQTTIRQVQGDLSALIEQKKEQVHYAILDKDNKERLFIVKVTAFKRGKEHTGYTFLLSDITELQAKEKQLEQLNEAKDRLFAIIGHDLRKPALAFRGISKKVNYLLQEKEFDRLNKFGNTLEQAAFALNSLLDNLLHWALQQRALLPYNPQQINVEEETKIIYDAFAQIADQKGISLERQIEASTTVFTDPNAFTTIVRNLVDNAIKYTPLGGAVEIKAQKVEKGVVIKIVDTGIGIKKELVDTLFSLQKDKSTRGTAGEVGSGLGLTLVRDLVELNKGKIEVSSKRNEGTTFEVFLPAEEV